MHVLNYTNLTLKDGVGLDMYLPYSFFFACKIQLFSQPLTFVRLALINRILSYENKLYELPEGR